jgi:hypothetical protein
MSTSTFNYYPWGSVLKIAIRELTGSHSPKGVGIRGCRKIVIFIARFVEFSYD